MCVTRPSAIRELGGRTSAVSADTRVTVSGSSAQTETGACLAQLVARSGCGSVVDELGGLLALRAPPDRRNAVLGDDVGVLERRRRAVQALDDRRGVGPVVPR